MSYVYWCKPKDAEHALDASPVASEAMDVSASSDGSSKAAPRQNSKKSTKTLSPTTNHKSTPGPTLEANLDLSESSSSSSTHNWNQSIRTDQYVPIEPTHCENLYYCPSYHRLNNYKLPTSSETPSSRNIRTSPSINADNNVSYYCNITVNLKNTNFRDSDTSKLIQQLEQRMFKRKNSTYTKTSDCNNNANNNENSKYLKTNHVADDSRKCDTVYFVSLDVSENHITCKGMKELANWFTQNSLYVRLKNLKAYKNAISDVGVQAVAELILKQPSALDELHLSHNLITSEGAAAIFKSFSHARRLTDNKAATYGKRKQRFIYPRPADINRGTYLPVWIRLEYNYIYEAPMVLFKWESECRALRNYDSNVKLICFADRPNITRSGKDPHCSPARCLRATLNHSPLLHLYSYYHQSASQPPPVAASLKSASLSSRNSQEKTTAAKNTKAPVKRNSAAPPRSQNASEVNNLNSDFDSQDKAETESSFNGKSQTSTLKSTKGDRVPLVGKEKLQAPLCKETSQTKSFAQVTDATKSETPSGPFTIEHKTVRTCSLKRFTYSTHSRANYSVQQTHVQHRSSVPRTPAKSAAPKSSKGCDAAENPNNSTNNNNSNLSNLNAGSNAVGNASSHSAGNKKKTTAAAAAAENCAAYKVKLSKVQQKTFEQIPQQKITIATRTSVIKQTLDSKKALTDHFQEILQECNTDNSNAHPVAGNSKIASSLVGESAASAAATDKPKQVDATSKFFTAIENEAENMAFKHTQYSPPPSSSGARWDIGLPSLSGLLSQICPKMSSENEPCFSDSDNFFSKKSGCTKQKFTQRLDLIDSAVVGIGQPQKAVGVGAVGAGSTNCTIAAPGSSSGGASAIVVGPSGNEYGGVLNYMNTYSFNGIDNSIESTTADYQNLQSVLKQGGINDCLDYSALFENSSILTKPSSLNAKSTAKKAAVTAAPPLQPNAKQLSGDLKNLTSQNVSTSISLDQAADCSLKQRGGGSSALSSEPKSVLPLYIFVDASAFADMRRLSKYDLVNLFSFPVLLTLCKNRVLCHSSMQPIIRKSSSSGASEKFDANQSLILMILNSVEDGLLSMTESQPFLRETLVELYQEYISHLAKLGVIESIDSLENQLKSEWMVLNEQMCKKAESYGAPLDAVKIIDFAFVWAHHLAKVSESHKNNATIKNDKFPFALFITNHDRTREFFHFLQESNLTSNIYNNLICISLDQFNSILRDAYPNLVKLVQSNNRAELPPNHQPYMDAQEIISAQHIRSLVQKFCISQRPSENAENFWQPNFATESFPKDKQNEINAELRRSLFKSNRLLSKLVMLYESQSSFKVLPCDFIEECKDECVESERLLNLNLNSCQNQPPGLKSTSSAFQNNSKLQFDRHAQYSCYM